MASRLSKRARVQLVVAGVTVVALVSGGGYWAATFSTSDSDPAAANCEKGSAQSFDSARQMALECKQDVEVLSERTPWHTSWAMADGTARIEVTTFPERIQDERGDWVGIDSSIEATGDTAAAPTSFEVAAPVFPMTINAGGSAGVDEPLGTISREGHDLAVYFPLPLPKPEVTESQARYALAEGVDLFLSVNVDATGFLPVVRLDSPDAAERLKALLLAGKPDSSDATKPMVLHFRTETSANIAPMVDEEGSIRFADEAGTTHFVVPPAVMWDSSGGEEVLDASVTEVGAVDRTRAPGGGDRIANMPMSVDGGTVAVMPDQQMLNDPATAWPVYIDPSFSGLSATEWTAVRTGGYTNSLYKWGDISTTMLGQGTGYCSSLPSCNVQFKQRLAWEFTGLSTISGLAGADIENAYMNVHATHSANCTAQTTTLHRTSDVGTGSLWGNLAWYEASGSRTEYHSNSCGNTGWKTFTATTAAKWIADNNQSALRLGLLVNEGSISYWKRFRANAALTINYNRAPNTPTSLQLTNPSVTTCVTGANRPVIATTTPTLSALLSDPDGGNVQATFVVSPASSPTTMTWSSGLRPAQASGLRASAAVTSGLTTGGVYAWKVRGYDGKRYGAWSGLCEFAVDTSKPAGPTVSPVTSGVSAIYEPNVERGGVGQTGTFRFDRGTATDVTTFLYGFNNSATPSQVTADTNGLASVSYTPGAPGPVVLTVKSRDAAGNVSTATSYTFIVATPTEDAVYTLDEGSGSSALESLNPDNRPIEIRGPQWGTGPHGLFDSRDGDSALLFDGANDFALADGPIVDTKKSFVVSAHVQLNTAATASPQRYTAIAQDGVQRAGFRLGYGPCSATGGCWNFSMPESATGTTEVVLNSSVPVRAGEWVHLVGQYNSVAKSMTLWACSIGTPSQPQPGSPASTTAPRAATPWAATGAFTIGRGIAAGVHGEWWPGAIDNLRVFSGEVVSETKIRRLCQGAEATDFGGGELALDPTTTAGE